MADYDFNIVFKQGRINTNADALSRVQLDSDALKEMLPKNIDIVTRSMVKDITNAGG